MKDCMDHEAGRPAAILLAKSAVAAAPRQEMVLSAARLEGTGRVSRAVYAFSEQGTPSLKEAVHALRDEGHADIVILPMLVPMEPSFHAWIARTVQRWHIEEGGDFPAVRVGRGLSEADDIAPILNHMLESALAAPVTPQNPKAATEGSVVSDRKHRVLVCMGGTCNQAGSAVLWGHLRNAQVEQGLMDKGEGMRSAKAGCLGPCALAPVVQVYPEGTFYGGVDEACMDRIIHEHLGEGRVVEDHAYHPGEKKQRLRERRAAGSDHVETVAGVPGELVD